MARVLFPDTASALAVRELTYRDLTPGAGQALAVFSDAGGTTPADITSDLAGTLPLIGAQTTIDPATGLPRSFYAPAGTATLWARVAGYAGLIQISGSGLYAPLAGKNGLTSSRIVGATTTGAPPTTGTWDAGDVIVDTVYGVQYQCTVAGTPGTWIVMAGGKTLQSITTTTPSAAIGTTSTVLLTLPTIVAGPLPLKIRAWCNQATGSAVTGAMSFTVFDESIVPLALDPWTVPSNGAVRGLNAYAEVSYPVGTSKTFTLYGRCQTAGTATYGVTTGAACLGLSVSQ